DGFAVGEPQELEWPELRPLDEPAVEREPDPVGARVVEHAPVVEPEPARDEIQTPVPMIRGGTLFGVPENTDEEPQVKKRLWPLRLSIAVVVLAAAAGAAYSTQESWMPIAQQRLMPGA